jgi:carbon-monoxide dehydrogenase small subunit
MEFKGRQTIRASRETVWAALNNHAVLEQCIDGCESFTSVNESEWQVVVRASVGPVKARFKGALTVQDRDPLKGYRLRGQGEGGIAGFGEMTAVVSLEDDGADTLLFYAAEAHVGGKLAQIGSRLVGSVGAKMADRFFARFNEVLTDGGDGARTTTTAAQGPGHTDWTDNENGKANVELTVNGLPVRRHEDDRTLLVELLRRELALTGTHVGCDTSQCGACTVSLDGVAVKSCTVLAVQASGGEVVTIEGLAKKDSMHPLQKAFMQCHALQCGFCTPGMIMASDGLLRSGQHIDHASICNALEGNICRCTGYINIIRAVEQAATEMGLPCNASLDGEGAR